MTRSIAVDRVPGRAGGGLPWLDTDPWWLANMGGVAESTDDTSDSLSCASTRLLRTRAAAERFGTRRLVLVPPSPLLARREAASPACIPAAGLECPGAAAGVP
jgi:hypothetical protein